MIPHPVSPVYSIRKKFLNISAFPNTEVPFAIPHKGKNQGNFTGKYRTVLMFGSDGCSDCSCPDPEHQYCLDYLPSPPLKRPFPFAS